jgi:hypothetical protein
MSRAGLVLLAVGCLLASSGRAQTTTTVPAGETPAGVQQETVVHGTPPALEGRWLAVTHVDAKGKTRTTVRFWDVASSAGGLTLTERFVSLPAAQQAALDEANAKGVAWDPSAAALGAVAADWDRLPSHDENVASVSNEIFSPEAFGKDITSEESMKHGLWVVRRILVFRPDGAALRQHDAFGALQTLPDGFAGNYWTTTVVRGPFLIPISFKGTFRLSRVEAAPARGWLARILDLFSGCGRKR